jgi:hypothetical protein
MLPFCVSGVSFFKANALYPARRPSRSNHEVLPNSIFLIHGTGLLEQRSV